MQDKVIFQIDKKIDFRNHLIGMRVYKQRLNQSPPELVKYYRKLEKANDKEKFEIFKERTKRFYSPEVKKFRELALRQTQEAWRLVEKKYFKKMNEIHNRVFPHKKVYGVLSTAHRFGYNFGGNKKWFACSAYSPSGSVDIAMHEIMHSIFHKYFFQKWQDKFSLKESQIWAIKESVTVILNIECSDIMFSLDRGHKGHEKLRAKIKKDWLRYKDFEKVLNLACEHVKNKKLFS